MFSSGKSSTPVHWFLYVTSLAYYFFKFSFWYNDIFVKFIFLVVFENQLLVTMGKFSIKYGPKSLLFIFMVYVSELGLEVFLGRCTLRSGFC